jgi:DNA invertase Pin-like site-specific DNA recombinase
VQTSPARLLDDQAHGAVRAMYDAGTHTIDEIAAARGESRPTVYRSLTRHPAVSPRVYETPLRREPDAIASGAGRVDVTGDNPHR